MDILAIVVLVVIVLAAVVGVAAKKSSGEGEARKEKDSWYEKKKLVTASESKFLGILKEFEKYELIVVPQVCLAAVVKKEGKFRYQSELYRMVDFGIFDKNYEVRCLIELNDSSHGQKYRQYRDIRVREIAKEAGIPLVTFYTNKPNERRYVLGRVSEVLKSGEVKRKEAK